MKAFAGVADCLYDGADDELKKFKISVVFCDNLLPVPLVNVDRVNVVKLLVAADRVHIGVKSVANRETVSFEGKSLPLCKGVHDLRVNSDGGYVKGNGALNSA